MENFPPIKNLKRLELAENQLCGAELKHIEKYGETLEILKLANNKISKITDLEPLKALKKLRSLDLEENDCTEE